MDGEQNEVVEPTQEQLDAQAFESGFTGTGPTETPGQLDEPQPEVVAPEPVKPWNMTEEVYQDLLAKQEKQFGTAFGKIGGIERALAAFQAAAPLGGAVEATADDFSDLAGEFPELAELQIKGFNKVLGRLKGTGTDPSAIDKLVNERVSEFTQQSMDAQLDGVVGGDWVAAVKSVEYKTWIAVQPQEVKALEASNSVRDAANLLRQFKAHKPVAPAPAPSTRQQQLAAAVAPRGAGGHPSSPLEDDFASGFKSGRV